MVQNAHVIYIGFIQCTFSRNSHQQHAKLIYNNSNWFHFPVNKIGKNTNQYSLTSPL